ncbi:MAG: phosphotransferase [Candidatus Nealsonbacteria bacterium]
MDDGKKEKILIPNINEKIKKKIKELDLKPEVSFQRFINIHKDGKHRYFSPCLTRNKKTVAFYVRLHNNPDAKEKFIREINFFKRLKTVNLEIKKIIPNILNYGIEEDFEWLIREYPKPPPLGHSRNLTQQPFPGMIEKITRAILEISQIHPETFLKLKSFNCQSYLSTSTYEDFARRKIISRELSEKILKMIKENLPLLEKENRYFCHGDLNLGNILSDQKNIWIIDWELIHLNNFAYDIGYLWAHLWEAKKTFRQRLIQSFLNSLNYQRLSSFKKLFPVVASYLSLGGIEYRKGKEKIEVLKKRRVFYLNLLKNCLNFKKLIKI